MSENTLPTGARNAKGGSEKGAVAWFFIIAHLSVFAAIWTGVKPVDLLVCAVLFVVRMFGITGGFHRYFSHRTYKMGRVMQFAMAWIATSAAQRSPFWWAAHHRHHHKFSDEPEDVHSPRQTGFWYSHVGWIVDLKWNETQTKYIPDLLKYPELRWLDRNYMVPPIALGLAVWLLFDWSGLVVGMMWSTVLLWHSTFTINSLSHVFGTRRYDTSDDSKNNWLLALLTLGEGWHNNHHHYQASCRQGFMWWEIDITYYVLKAMSWVGLVWDIREPPRHVVRNERHPEALRRLAESAAQQSSAGWAAAKQMGRLAGEGTGGGRPGIGAKSL